ncbi:MAG: hypothetical protein NUV74_12260 [Candidatus Brocadiaceae bacterium]|nr:hypothetical protein [Candidatus Brocadiaceae bacterium]
MWLLCNVAAIHELPLHIATEAVSTTNVFKKLNCYKNFSNYTPQKSEDIGEETRS